MTQAEKEFVICDVANGENGDASLIWLSRNAIDFPYDGNCPAFWLGKGSQQD